MEQKSGIVFIFAASMAAFDFFRIFMMSRVWRSPYYIRSLRVNKKNPDYAVDARVLVPSAKIPKVVALSKRSEKRKGTVSPRRN